MADKRSKRALNSPTAVPGPFEAPASPGQVVAPAAVRRFRGVSAITHEGVVYHAVNGVIELPAHVRWYHQLIECGMLQEVEP
jgi:hypothetical protein